ncbi:hypothetical protein [Streptomyces sp. NRRL S-118]|uniref:hypothetical protein n=1 Tax=Streptomyces sp. NRRL S-118 TaxID=1463881 RepID=UPI0004C8EBC3|nr:hypothetical protein [Streptomyces sp. NRRL S-118]
MDHLLGGLAANPALPSGLVDRLIATADADAASYLADQADLSPVQAVALAHRFGDEVAVHLAYAGRLPAADVDPGAWPRAALALLDTGAGRPEWARRFAADPDAGLREKLAACPGLPPDVLESLAGDADTGVVTELGLWTTVPATAALLARHPHAEVRRAVATNTRTPPAELVALLTGEGLPPARWCSVCEQEEIPFVHEPYCPLPDCALRPGASCDGSHASTVHETRRFALRNPMTPVEAAAGFVRHPSPLLRRELAARPDLPPGACELLAADPDPGVRSGLAGNPAIGEALIRTLAADGGHDVQRRLAHHPRIPWDVLARVARTTRIGPVLLPGVAAASAAEVGELAASADPLLRMLVAERRDLPPAVREALAADPDAKVAKAVAPHPGLPGEVLRAMVRRHGDQVAARVAANPDAPPGLLERLARQERPPRKALREIARHPRATAAALTACLADPRARPLAAAHPALPPQVVAELLADDDPQVGAAAAANPSLPPAEMARLTRP